MRKTCFRTAKIAEPMGRTRAKCTCDNSELRGAAPRTSHRVHFTAGSKSVGAENNNFRVFDTRAVLVQPDRQYTERGGAFRH